MKTIVCVLAGTVCAAGGAAMGQVSFTGSAYTQNFDTLFNTNATASAWANNSTLPGWSLFRRQDAANEGPAVAITTFTAGNASGPSTGGNIGFYSFGDVGSTERGLGGTGGGVGGFGTVAEGAVCGWIAVAITNNTGVTMGSATISFDGEQWRAPAGGAQTMVLEYGFGSTFTGVSSWTAPGGTFNWTTPIFGGAAGVGSIGNTTGHVTGVGGTLSGLNWANGDTLWVRWIERNDTGNDHSLGIDNFSFVPGPGAGLPLGMLLVSSRRKRRLDGQATNCPVRVRSSP